jgi:uncharacterized protein (TIGR04255 family)
MPRTELKNKPLVEAIFELRWDLPIKSGPGFASDPNYRILLGRFFERVNTEYPSHTQLALASLPDDMAPFSVQHQFRVKENGWPLVQIGPGIITANDTDGYTWTDFKRRCESIVEILFAVYPKREELKIEDVTLRYLDAIECDFESESVFRFLHDKMKINVELPGNLFKDLQVESDPSSFTWQVSFPCKSPEGALTVGFAMGQKASKPAFIWQTVIQSKGPEAPDVRERFSAWLDGAHAITADWFFKLIEGELERRFSSDQ